MSAVTPIAVKSCDAAYVTEGPQPLLPRRHRRRTSDLGIRRAVGLVVHFLEHATTLGELILLRIDGRYQGGLVAHCHAAFPSL
jgi:hypothetical protein